MLNIFIIILLIVIILMLLRYRTNEDFFSENMCERLEKEHPDGKRIRQTICQESNFSCDKESKWYKCCKDSKYNCSPDGTNTIGEIKCCID